MPLLHPPAGITPRLHFITELLGSRAGEQDGHELLVRLLGEVRERLEAVDRELSRLGSDLLAHYRQADGHCSAALDSLTRFEQSRRPEFLSQARQEVERGTERLRLAVDRST